MESAEAAAEEQTQFPQTAVSEPDPYFDQAPTTEKPKAEADKLTQQPLTQDAAPDLKAQRLVPLAFGSDGFPKVRKYYREKEAGRPLERIESDFNGDGRVDFVEWYDPSGQFVERETADLDGNGRLNVVSFYKKVIGQNKRELEMQEFDAKFEGKPSVWKHYRGGILARREIDRKSAGRPDYWEHYDDGKLVRIEKDENADGIPDSQPAFKPVLKPQSPEPGKTKAQN